MEEVLHERLLGIAAGGHVVAKLPRPLKRGCRALPWLVGTRGIDRLLPRDGFGRALLYGAIPTDRVELFEREAQRIDHRMAGLAGDAARLDGDAFAGREIGMLVWRQRGDCLLGRLENVAHHAAGEEHAAVDRRRCCGVGEHARHVGVRQHARTAAAIEPHAAKRRVCRQIDAVERSEPPVHVDLVVGEQSPEIGTAARAPSPDGIIHQHFQARPQIRRDLRGEL